MIPTTLFYVSLFMYILPVPSLLVTVPTQPQPYVNDSTSVLLTWSPEDPSRFFIAVERIFSPDANIISFIQPVENFTATHNASVVFEFAGQTFIEAIKTSPTQANTNVTVASSEPFQVDEGLENSSSASSAIESDSSSATSPTMTVPSTSTVAPASSSSKHDHTAAVIAAVLSGIILLVLTAASVFIWRFFKRRNIARQGTFSTTNFDDEGPHVPSMPAFSTNFDDERPHIPSMPAFCNNLDERERRALPTSPSDHSSDVPPPSYSSFIRE